jgi:Flp pilus assembly pilin Flp
MDPLPSSSLAGELPAWQPSVAIATIDAGSDGNVTTVPCKIATKARRSGLPAPKGVATFLLQQMTTRQRVQQRRTAMLKRLLIEDSAQGMTEYAILVGTLALGAIATLLLIGNKVKNVFNGVDNALNSVPTS